ncbi:MAG: hypothetical protein EBU34_12305, partial [Alphaproteobacteria bacterium]|nr:hypothetical protein [Alphaproteobacteria bacterium]
MALFLVLTDSAVAHEAKALIAVGAQKMWAQKRVNDGYDAGTGIQADSPKSRMANVMQEYVDNFACVPVLVLACLVRYREPTPSEGASVYPACQNILLAARALGYGGVLTGFQAFAENPDLDFFISGVNSDLFTQEPCFYLARPIRSASGEKLGLILVGLPSSFFSSFYQAAILGDLDISLIRRDGAVLSHILNVKELVSGKNQMSSDIMSRMRNAERGLHFIGGLNTRFSFDEMLFFQLSPVLPIGMSVAVSRDEILSAWRQQSINFAILGGSMSSLLIILTLILARLIKQLEQTRNAALSAAEAKTLFITTISHELRTPMNAIVGGAYQLRSAELKPDDQHFLQIVSSSAQQLNILLNDILD